MELKRHKKTRRGCRGVESQHRRDALKRVQYRQRSQESAHLSMVRCLQDRRQELARQAERASKAVRKQDGVTERLSQTQKDLAVATLRLDGVSAQLRDARHELAEKEDRLAEAEQQLFAVETRLQRTQAWLEAVLRDNEQKDLLIEELKYEMAMLLEEDRASKEDHQLEWIQAKLELMQQLSEVKQVAKERLRENTVLRRVIGKQLQADVKVLGTPMQGDDLPRMPDGSINQEANLEEWMQITSDTIFVWNRDSAEEERIGGEKGQVAFAVFHRPEEVMDHLPTFLGIFDHIDRFRYRLKRHTIKEHGKVWGLGIRAGFDKDRSYGAYAVPPEGKLSGRERSRFPENVAIEGLGAQAAEILECVFKRRVPCEMAERHGIVLCDDVPTMGESESTTGMIATEGYRVDRHVDTDLGVAYGVWFEVHSPECRQETCCERWAFLFPEYRIAVPISNGTCIIWRGKQVAHLTILKVSANACQGHRALSLVTQIKKVLIDRVRSHNRRHFQHEI